MKRVLILDDEPDIVNVITMILEDEGYHVNGIGTGADLFTKVDSFKPDLIILDVMLGLYDGRTLCIELKATDLTKHIPVLMISASHDLLSMGDTNFQPNDFLSKPFDIDELAFKVKTQLYPQISTVINSLPAIQL